MLFAGATFGQGVSLGSAKNFMIFTGSGAVSNTGVSNVTGDIGTNLGSVSGFGPATVNGSSHAANAITAQAKADVFVAYNQLIAIPATVSAHAPAFGTETLTAGVYTIAGAGSVAGNLTLDGLGDTCALFVFRFGGAFATAASSAIILTNGAKACNVYWVSEGASSLGASTIMKGTLITNAAAVSAAAGCDIEGRMLSTNGAISFGPAVGYIPTLCCPPYVSPAVTSCCNPDFGGTIKFAVFTSDGAITNAGISNYTGHIGSDNGSISGFGTSTVNGSFFNSDAKTAKTKVDLTNLYSQLILNPTTHASHTPAFGNGETITNGVYEVAGAGSLAGVITLDAQNDTNAIFIFKFGGAFAVGAASEIRLINLASSCSVFWVAEGAVSVGAGGIMKGTFIANNGAIAATANCSIEGRLFSTSGAITFDKITVDNSASCQNPTFDTVTTTWNGTVSSDWFTDSNWDMGKPDSIKHAVIPAGPANMPVISFAGAACKSLDINASSNLTLSGSNGIDIYGDWITNGTFNGDVGTVTLKGTLYGNKIRSASTLRIKNLTIDNESLATITSGRIELTGALNIVTGNLNTNDSLTLISNVSGTARIGEIPSHCKYTLDMSDSWSDGWNGGFINALVDGVSIGHFYAHGANSKDNLYISSGSTLKLEYTAGSSEDENSYTLYDGSGNNIFSDNANPTTGVVFTTTANCNFVNPISGNITMQRYVSTGGTSWRFLTSPVSGTTIADFNDDFSTTGFPGSNYPTYPSAANPWTSIFYYDETISGVEDSGFVAVTDTNNTVSAGQGIWAWVWAGNSTNGTQPFTLDLEGPVNTGTIDLPISYTNTGSVNDDGWNMVGNPYPSAIDWDSPGVTKTGMNSAIYIWNPDIGQFATYVFGIGTNGGSRHIASSQAIWLQSNSPGASVQLNESSKTTVGATFFKREKPSYLSIEAVNSDGVDETIISFQQNATTNFDGVYDALKMEPVNSLLPSISTQFNDSVEFSINQLPRQEINIPLKVTCGASGVHKISFNGVSNFTNSSCVLLEDLFTGVIYDLRITDSISVTISDTTTIARFLIKFGAETVTSVANVSCNGLSDGSIVMTKNSLNPFDVIWKDDQNNTLLSQTNVLGSDSIIHIPSGIYFIETEDNVCGNLYDSVSVEEPLQILAEFKNASDTIDLAKGGFVDFTNQSSNANYYTWDFGDFNYSTDVSPTHQYFRAGVYNVAHTAYQTPTCYSSVYKDITVLDLATSSSSQKELVNTKIWINDKVLSIKQENIQAIYISDILGKMLFSSQEVTDEQQFNLSDLSSQTLIISVQTRTGLNSSKIVFINN
ncbi:MAG: hypothetical protein ACJAWO_000557 [Halieaceae bacterium]|jgi:hypothetical protein